MDALSTTGGQTREVAVEFHVGPYVYRLVVSDRSIFDAEGNELEGCAVEGRRLVILSRIVEPERREEVAAHELIHAWAFHAPKPSDEEERCQFHAMIAEQFRRDLEVGGGRERLLQLPRTCVPHLGRPVPQKLAPATVETFGRTDRVSCACCESETACGSVHNSDPEPHPTTGRQKMQRWFRCEICATVTAWWEWADDAGLPTGEYVSVPAPRMLQGAEAARWMAEQAAMQAA